MRIIKRADGTVVRYDSEGNRTVTEANTISRVDFVRRFTVQEYVAIEDSADPQVRYLRGLVDRAERINLTDADLGPGLHYLEMIGLLGPGRASEILTGVSE